jgi:hypothetical protein
MRSTPNRLASTSSPYLLQHAFNPVDWWPWTDAALAHARALDRPIFLSIGYSTCYWCHVMERESFEHEPTAQLMNELFVCIKLDREERPDLDELYMAATVTMTGRGGWPMSVFLDPDTLRPFYCGTYFPRDPRHGLPSFSQVLRGMADAWATKRADVAAQADRLAAAVTEQLAAAPEPTPVGAMDVSKAIQLLLQIFDKTNGGFGGAPKFPQPSFCTFLLDARAKAADEPTLDAIDRAVRTTLDAMLIGGIHDHAAGGFHRYAVDATWTVPHFEKMLYDNAQLLALYARAASAYADEHYARAARRCAQHILRDMRLHPRGTGVTPVQAHIPFASALDAEVDHREGLNYLWTADQARAGLWREHADLAIDLFDLDHPNFQDPHHPEDEPACVLRLAARPDALAERAGQDDADFTRRLDTLLDAMLAVRATRRQPHRDDKVLTSWNALAIAALADASVFLGDPALLDAAESAAAYLLARHRDQDGQLLRASRPTPESPDAPAHTPGILEDHAFLCKALLALARALPCFDRDGSRPLAAAADIARRAIDRFADVSGAVPAGFFDTAADAPDLFARARAAHDGAMPSASSVMLDALLDLAELDPAHAPLWRAHAAGTLAAVSPAIAENPVGVVNSTRLLLRVLPQRDRFTTLDPAFAALFAPDSGRTPSQRERELTARADAARAPIEIYASSERIAITDATPGELTLILKIPEGYHLVAADPGPHAPEGLIPLRVGLVSGSGVAVYCDYPRGTPSTIEGVGTVFVHDAADHALDEGGLTLRVAIEKAPGVGPSPGRPILGLSFQACTDTACMRPRTVELDVALDIS